MKYWLIFDLIIWTAGIKIIFGELRNRGSLRREALGISILWPGIMVVLAVLWVLNVICYGFSKSK